MTHAVCIFCGEMKFGCLLPCKSCGAVPREPMDRTYSLVYSDHHIDLEELEKLSAQIRETGMVPALPPEVEKKMHEGYSRAFGRDP